MDPQAMRWTPAVLAILAVGLLVIVVPYLYRRWLAGRILNKALKHADPVSLEDAKNGVIVVEPEGLTVRKKDATPRSLRWDEVREIRAFKTDLFSTDLICWSFVAEPEALDVHEEMSGFLKLQEAVTARFGVRLEDWFSKVAFPAFEPNLTVLWRKPE